MDSKFLRLPVGLISCAVLGLSGPAVLAAEPTGNLVVDEFIERMEDLGDLSMSFETETVSNDDATLVNVVLSFKADAPDLKVKEVIFRGADLEEDGTISFEQLSISDVLMEDEEGRLSIADLSSAGFQWRQAPDDLPESLKAQYLAPLYSSFALADFELNLFGDGPREIAVEAITASANDYLDDIPLNSQFSMVGISIPASALDDRQAEAVLADMDLDRITANLAGMFAVDPDESLVEIDDLTIEVEDMGSIGLEATLGNISFDQIVALQNATTEAATETALMSMLGGTLNELSLEIIDDTMTEKILNYAAKQMGVSSADLVAQAPLVLPLALSALGNLELQTKITRAAMTFLKEPDTLRAWINPEAPIPFGALMAGAQQPEQLIELLGIDIAANEE